MSDATDTSAENIGNVVKWMGGKDVGVLVNNVGIHQGGPKPFHKIGTDQIVSSVNVNCLYPTLLTSAVLNKILLPRAKRSLIINLSSVVGCSTATPGMSVYAATKAFNHQYSLCLSYDLLDKNIDVTCVCPGLTASLMTRMKSSLFCSSAEECAEGALNKTGLVDVIPHWKHALLWLFMAEGDWVPAVPRAWFMSKAAKRVKLPSPTD